MKTILILTLSVFTFSCSNAQKMNDADVPAAVKNSFSKKFPGAKVEKWEKEGNDYEAEFDWNKTESSAVFDAAGTFKEIESEIKTSELPKNVTEYCQKNYAEYKISEAAKITDANGKVMYEAELSKGKEHFDVIFDQNGNFIKKSGVVSKSEEEKD